MSSHPTATAISTICDHIEALRTFGTLLIVGDNGSGKSTVLNELCRRGICSARDERSAYMGRAWNEASGDSVSA